MQMRRRKYLLYGERVSSKHIEEKKQDNNEGGEDQRNGESKGGVGSSAGPTGKSPRNGGAGGDTDRAGVGET